MRWLAFLSNLAIDALVLALRPRAPFRAPPPAPPMTPRDERYEVWISDGEGPLMHAGAMRLSDAWRATVGR